MTDAEKIQALIAHILKVQSYLVAGAIQTRDDRRFVIEMADEVLKKIGRTKDVAEACPICGEKLYCKHRDH
jgi:hypothetical protein